MRCPFCVDYLIETGRYSVVLSDICSTQGYNKAIDGHEVIESSITNGAVLDIIPHDATDDVKIRRLN